MRFNVINVKRVIINFVEILRLILKQENPYIPKWIHGIFRTEFPWHAMG